MRIHLREMSVFLPGLVAVTLAGSAGCSSTAEGDPEVDTEASWTVAASPAAFPPRMGHLGMVFKDRMWIMAGEGTDGDDRNDVWSSADGKTWTMATAAAAWSPRSLAGGAVFNDK